MTIALTELKILVISNNPLARIGLMALLGNFSNCVVVGQLALTDDLPEIVSSLETEVILWDFGWSTGIMLDHLAEWGGVPGFPPVVALLPDEADFNHVQATGAQGILLQDSPAERLIAALMAAAQGLTVLDPAFTLPGSHHIPPETLNEALTKRESQVLQLLAEGLPNKTIAHELGISEHTIKFHVNAIMSKLGVQSRTEAVVKASKLGLIIL